MSSEEAGLGVFEVIEDGLSNEAVISIHFCE